MSINFSGIREGMDWIDRDNKFEFAKQKFFSGEKKERIALLAEYGVNSKESTKRRAKKTELTQSLISTVGLPKDVASYIAETGEGKIILELFEKRVKEGTLNVNWIPTIIKKVESTLADKSSLQAKAIAAKTALLSSEDMSTEVGQEGSLIEAIFSAETFEDFEKVDEKILEIVTAPRLEEFTPELPTIGGLNVGSAMVGETQLASIRKQVIDRIAPYAGEIFVKDNEGDYRVDPAKIKSDQSAGELEKIISGTVDNIVIDVETGSSNLNESFQKHIPNAVNLIPSFIGSKQPKVKNPKVIKNPADSFDAGKDLFTDNFKSIEEERNR
tara:strand:+ start:3869 stop:4852 length:984 start_codon:yes stop_codon:yes gene_type:complete